MIAAAAPKTPMPAVAAPAAPLDLDSDLEADLDSDLEADLESDDLDLESALESDLASDLESDLESDLAAEEALSEAAADVAEPEASEAEAAAEDSLAAEEDLANTPEAAARAIMTVVDLITKLDILNVGQQPNLYPKMRRPSVNTNLAYKPLSTPPDAVSASCSLSLVAAYSVMNPPIGSF